MKNKYFKLNWTFFTFLLFVFIFSLAKIVLADSQLSFFHAGSTSSVSGQCASGQSIYIVNKSSRSYFIPNKTVAEFNSFIAHTPNYLSVSICSDGACTNGETTANCPSDCPVLNSGDFCGDGLCSSDGAVVSSNGTVTYGETCSNCAIDCGLCKTYGCGECGENSDGQLCPNTCYYSDSQGTSCLRRKTPFSNLSTYGALANPDGPATNQKNIGRWSYYEKYDWASPSVQGDTVWSCPHPSSDLCPVGYYCPPDGNTSNLHHQCPAGFYCPAGSGKPSFCPSGTYSSAGASKCTACPSQSVNVGDIVDNFIYTPLMATNSTQCQRAQYCGDGVCDTFINTLPQSYPGGLLAIMSENPLNCPQDCQTTPSGSLRGDGRCTGSENYSNDPAECTCGNGKCDAEENATNCQVDCHYCGDGTCNSPSETYANCPADCKCGDGTCGFGESHANCPADCKCGDGTCGTGETASNCSVDCHCGNGTCEKNLGEGKTSCPADCKCGDGICDTPSETNSNCSADCPPISIKNVCGDGICGVGENKTCPADCGFVESCGDGICNHSETKANCPVDCNGSGGGLTPIDSGSMIN